MRLVVFDMDGTLVDSQHHIHAAMTAAFERVGLPPPALAEVHAIVGLSLPIAIARMRPSLAVDAVEAVVAAYKASHHDRSLMDSAPLFPGAREGLLALAAHPGLALGVATGKGRRGLDAMLAHHGIDHLFVATECADDHPSKPAPGMLLAACATAGVAPGEAAMVGDTSFDLDMANAAGALPVGVGWGYHPDAVLDASGAAWIAPDFPALTRWLLERAS